MGIRYSCLRLDVNALSKPLLSACACLLLLFGASVQVGKVLGMFGGKPVDAFDYWSQQVEDATSALSEAQDKALSKP